jgi:8-oxo-dGTP diphosphatase
LKPTIKVVCGIICKGDTYFIARRKPDKNLGGYWEFPGGKIEEGESPISALERELMEELGMKVNAINYFGNHQYEYEKFIINLLGYTCNYLGASFNMTDHDKHEFVTATELKKFDLAPADREFAKRILEMEVE